MEISGRVKNGVVVLDRGVELPEGTRVTVVYDPPVKGQAEKRRVEFPLVRTGEPGTLNLTNQRIAEIFEEEDLAAYRKAFARRADERPPP